MNRNFFQVFVLVFLTASCIIIIQPVKASEDSWTTKAPMPTARFSFGVASVNGKIYAIGGAVSTQSGTLLANNEEYDSITDTWYEKAPLPIPTYGCAVASYGNQIYVFGGQIKGNNSLEVNTNATKVYDIVTDTWVTKAPMPAARSLLEANVVGGKIYLVGGDVNGTFNEVYDPATDTWSTKASMPTAAYAYASGVVDNKIYVISDLTQIYDPQTDTWSLGATIPVDVAGAGSAVITDVGTAIAIYVIGGETDIFSPQTIVQIYFPENNSWGFGASLPEPTSRLCAAALNNVLYAIGGTRAVMHQGITDNWQGTPGPNLFVTTPSPSPSPTIPEFPTSIILPLVVIGILLTVLFTRREKSQIDLSHYSQ
jgi:N-acetylneuraminic acid mutarotase